MDRGTRGERARIEDEGLRYRRRGRNRLRHERTRRDDDGRDHLRVLARLAVRAACVGRDRGALRIHGGAAGMALGRRRRPSRAGQGGVRHRRQDERQDENREPQESGLSGHYQHSMPIHSGSYDGRHIYRYSCLALRAARAASSRGSWAESFGRFAARLLAMTRSSGSTLTGNPSRS